MSFQFKNTRQKTMTKLALLSCGLLFNALQVISIAIADMCNYFSGYTAGQIQMFITVPSVLSFIGFVLSSLIANKIGRKRTLLIAIVLLGISGVAPFFIRNYEYIFAARLLLGFSSGIINPVSTGLLSSLFPENERASLMGFQSVAVNLGQMGMSAVVSALVIFGWQYCFLVYALAFAVFFVCVLFLPYFPQVTVESASEHNTGGQVKMPPIIWLFFGLVIVYYALQMNIYTNLSLAVEQAGIGSASQLGVAMTVMSIASLLIGIVFGKLHRKLGDWLNPISFLVTGAGCLLLFFAKSMAVLIVGLVVFGIGFAIFLPYCLTKAPGLVKAQSAGTAVSIIAAATSIGGFISPYMLLGFQKLSGMWAAQDCFLFSAGIMLLVGMVLLCTKKQHKQNI